MSSRARSRTSLASKKRIDRVTGWLSHERRHAEERLTALGLSADAWRVLDDVAVEWDGISTGFSRAGAEQALGGPEIINGCWTIHAEAWAWAQVAAIADLGTADPRQSEASAMAVQRLLDWIETLAQDHQLRGVMRGRAKVSAVSRKKTGLRSLVDKAKAQGHDTRTGVLEYLKKQPGVTIDYASSSLQIEDRVRSFRTIDNYLAKKTTPT